MENQNTTQELQKIEYRSSLNALENHQLLVQQFDELKAMFVKMGPQPEERWEWDDWFDPATFSRCYERFTSLMNAALENADMHDSGDNSGPISSFKDAYEMMRPYLRYIYGAGEINGLTDSETDPRNLSISDKAKNFIEPLSEQLSEQLDEYEHNPWWYPSHLEGISQELAECMEDIHQVLGNAKRDVDEIIQRKKQRQPKKQLR